jgi:hypothetical protein
LQAFFAKVGIQAEIEMVDASRMQTYLTGTYKNGVMLTPLMEWANPNSVYNFFFGVPGSYFQVVKRPDGWKDLLMAKLPRKIPHS